MMKFLKDGSINVFWGLVATLLGAYIFGDSGEVDLGNWATIILTIPLFLGLGAAAAGALSLYAAINLLELIAAKLGLIDIIDIDFGA